MTNQPGFFERLTGARVMGHSGAETIEYEDDLVDAEIQIGEQPEEFVEEAVEEPEPEQPEQDFSDESVPETTEPDTGADTDAEFDEQEGQLTVDVFQDDTNIVIQSTIAGVAPEELDVSITNDMVTIRGQRRHTFDVKQEDYFYQECYWGAFSRSIILPVEINADQAEAKIKNGILTIRIPKAIAAMTRKLEIKTS